MAYNEHLAYGDLPAGRGNRRKRVSSEMHLESFVVMAKAQAQARAQAQYLSNVFNKVHETVHGLGSDMCR